MTGVAAFETGDVGLSVPARLAFVDLVALLTPIQDAAPAGAPLRYDPVYDRIREARREDDSSLPQGIWTRDLKKADWSEVDRVGSAATVMRGKDLQVGGWLLEAWIHLHGFAGARQGFELLFGLADRCFWPTRHPLPDGADFGARTATIEWVNEKLVTAVAAIPVTAPADRAIRAWTWAERDDVLRHENEQRRAMPKGGKPAAPADPKGAQFTFDAFGVSAGATPRQFFIEAVEDLNAAITAARALVMIVDEQCGLDAPSLALVIDTMTAIREWMKPLSMTPVAEVMPDQPVVDEVVAASSGAADAPMNGERMDPLTDAAAASPTDHARARADAYRKLAEAAQTLMRIEPHSPTPYLVRRAIAWGDMSLAELMRHFIDSGYDLKSLYSMLGMDEGEEQ